MDNNNYNTNLKTVYDHMKLSKSDRQAHIDKNTKCYGYELKHGKNKGQWSNQSKHAKQSLLDYHQIEDFGDRQIHTCHKCQNDSTRPNGFICINPQHLYFGSSSENMMDKPKNVRKKGGKAPAGEKTKKASSETQKKLLKEGRHQTQIIHTCPHCGHEGTGPIMKRWHFDNCLHA